MVLRNMSKILSVEVIWNKTKKKTKPSQAKPTTIATPPRTGWSEREEKEKAPKSVSVFTCGNWKSSCVWNSIKNDLSIYQMMFYKANQNPHNLFYFILFIFRFSINNFPWLFQCGQSYVHRCMFMHFNKAKYMLNAKYFTHIFGLRQKINDYFDNFKSFLIHFCLVQSCSTHASKICFIHLFCYCETNTVSENPFQCEWWTEWICLG